MFPWSPVRPGGATWAWSLSMSSTHTVVPILLAGQIDQRHFFQRRQPARNRRHRAHDTLFEIGNDRLQIAALQQRGRFGSIAPKRQMGLLDRFLDIVRAQVAHPGGRLHPTPDLRLKELVQDRVPGRLFTGKGAAKEFDTGGRTCLPSFEKGFPFLPTGVKQRSSIIHGCDHPNG